MIQHSNHDEGGGRRSSLAISSQTYVKNDNKLTSLHVLNYDPLFYINDDSLSNRENKGNMYVTKRLSEYQKNPSELTSLPTEGPNSGVLVIQDEESRTPCCFGKCFDWKLHGLPFPQNTKVTVRFQVGS